MKKKLIYSLSGMFFALALMSPSCEKNEESSTTIEQSSEVEIPKEIEQLTYSYIGGYEDLWLKVDSLQELGLYKSALDVVKVIFEQAKTENNAPEVVKSVIHKMKFNSYMTEEENIVSINELNELSTISTFPLKQIIHSITAESYWVYYQTNRWKFLNRTQTVNFDNTDIRTWDLNKIADHVNKHYMLSLENTDSLQHTNIKDFKTMLIGDNNSDQQRPTLYDFLAHRALDFFESPESSLSRPDDKFIIKGIEFFSKNNVFVNTNTASKDSMSNALYATKILVELTRFHKDDKEASAIIDLTLRRLDYARKNSVEQKKDELYLVSLNSLSEKYISHKGYAEIRFKCASFFNEMGLKYNTKTKENQWERTKAVEICDEAINRYPKSHGAEQCEGLKTQIKQKNISFNTEMAYAPNSKGKCSFNIKILIPFILK